jgi:hypothetical protein
MEQFQIEVGTYLETKDSNVYPLQSTMQKHSAINAVWIGLASIMEMISPNMWT